MLWCVYKAGFAKTCIKAQNLHNAKVLRQCYKCAGYCSLVSIVVVFIVPCVAVCCCCGSLITHAWNAVKNIGSNMLYEPCMWQQQMTIYNVAITSTVKRLCVASAGGEVVRHIHTYSHVLIFHKHTHGGNSKKCHNYRKSGSFEWVPLMGLMCPGGHKTSRLLQLPHELQPQKTLLTCNISPQCQFKCH